MKPFRPLTLPHASLILMLGTTLACRSPFGNRGSDTLDKVPFNAGDVEPKLGEGYDSLTQELRNTPECVTGTAIKLNSNSSSIDLQQNIDSKDMMREFSGEVQGTPRLVFLQTGIGAGFFRSLTQKSSALSVVYGIKIQAGGEKLTGVKLGYDVKPLVPTELFRRCGDSYVMQINRGGLLAITLNFDFGSDEGKNKWQGKLKLGGGLGELSKGLTRKIQEDGIDGSLTIHVNQLGGTVNQPLLAVRTCPLGTSEDFAVCKAQLDLLTTYASEKFPQEVQNQPAIINYVTASLQTLGVNNLPKLDKAVIEARRELQNYLQINNQHAAMMEKAKTVGLPFEEALAGAISTNRNTINQAAADCFKYSLTEKGVDWRTCMTGYDRLKKDLKVISPAATTVNELNIRARSEIGNSIVNEYDRKIRVAYKVAASNTAKPGCSASVRGASLRSPQDHVGALLVRTEGTYQGIGGGGSGEIYPGEALGFVINDVKGGYRDNLGSQTIYWRCTDCNPAPKKIPTYRVVVRADSEEGAVFRSRQPRSTDYQFLTYGQWRSSSRAAWSGASGGRESCSSNCPVPAAPKQALVVTAPIGSRAMGRDGCLLVNEDGPVSFRMNDERGAYGDNQGEMEIILQAKRCGLNSHPINLRTSRPADE